MTSILTTTYLNELVAFSEVLERVGIGNRKLEEYLLKANLHHYLNLKKKVPIKMSNSLKKKIHVEALFALQDLMEVFFEHPNIVPMKLANCLGVYPEYIRTYIYELDETKAPPRTMNIIGTAFIELLSYLITSASLYKKTVLDLEVVHIQPSTTFLIKITTIPHKIREELGIQEPSVLYQDLIHIMENTGIFVTDPQSVLTSSWKELDYVKVEKAKMESQSLFIMRDIPHVVFVDSPWRLPNLFWSKAHKVITTASFLDLLFYFRTEKWTAFIKDIVRSAAVSAARKMENAYKEDRECLGEDFLFTTMS